MKRIKISFGESVNNLVLFDKRIDRSTTQFKNTRNIIPSVYLCKEGYLIRKVHFYTNFISFYFLEDSKIKIFKEVINIYVEVYWDLENRLNKILKIPRV